jgi:hypothetical protein
VEKRLKSNSLLQQYLNRVPQNPGVVKVVSRRSVTKLKDSKISPPRVHVMPGHLPGRSSFTAQLRALYQPARDFAMFTQGAGGK